jgi:uncharacterized membrane protein
MENTEQKFTFSTDKDPMRVIALSDGLFATVLTLLVLDLKIPDLFMAGGGNVGGFFAALGPHLFSYLMTYLVTGIFWLTHHRHFDHIVRYDQCLINYNLLFLLFVGLFPFSTTAISMDDHLNTNYPVFWAIYAINIAAAGIMQILTWNYAMSHQLVHTDTSPQQSRNITLIESITPVVFLLSIAAEYLFPQAFFGLYTLMLIPVLKILLERKLIRSRPEANTGQGKWKEFLWQSGTVLPWLIIFGFAYWTKMM